MIGCRSMRQGVRARVAQSFLYRCDFTSLRACRNRSQRGRALPTDEALPVSCDQQSRAQTHTHTHTCLVCFVIGVEGVHGVSHQHSHERVCRSRQRRRNGPEGVQQSGKIWLCGECVPLASIGNPSASYINTTCVNPLFLGVRGGRGGGGGYTLHLALKSKSPLRPASYYKRVEPPSVAARGAMYAYATASN